MKIKIDNKPFENRWKIQKRKVKFEKHWESVVAQSEPTKMKKNLCKLINRTFFVFQSVVKIFSCWMFRVSIVFIILWL